MRASISVLGPLVARCGAARVALPGGDAIGSRGLDMHIAGLERLGADDRQRARLPRRHGARRLTRRADLARLPVSVGATENLLMAAVLAEGTTVIDNAAREPEIVDLCADARRDGRPDRRRRHVDARVEGVDALHPVEHTTVPDRIVAGTWAFAAVMTRGDVVDRAGRRRAPRRRAGQARRRRRARSSGCRRRLPGRDGRPAALPSTS